MTTPNQPFVRVEESTMSWLGASQGPQPWGVSCPVAMLDPPVEHEVTSQLGSHGEFGKFLPPNFPRFQAQGNQESARDPEVQVHPFPPEFGQSSASFPVSAHPTSLSPTRARAAVASVRPNDVQNAPMYPSNSASALSLFSNRDARVTLLATIPMMASPIDVPNCAMVLNTAPASALVSSENSLLMVTRPTQKSTSADS